MTITHDSVVEYETSEGHGVRWVCQSCGQHGPYTGNRATTQVDYLNTHHALNHTRPSIEHECGAGGSVTVWIDVDGLGWRVSQLPVTNRWMLEATVDRSPIAVLGLHPTLEAAGKAIGVDL
jgi:hypothetical protein